MSLLWKCLIEYTWCRLAVRWTHIQSLLSTWKAPCKNCALFGRGSRHTSAIITTHYPTNCILHSCQCKFRSHRQESVWGKQTILSCLSFLDNLDSFQALSMVAIRSVTMSYICHWAAMFVYHSLISLLDQVFVHVAWNLFNCIYTYTYLPFMTMYRQTTG